MEVRCNVVYVDGKPVQEELADPNCTYWNQDDLDGTPGPWMQKTCTLYKDTLDGKTFFTLHGFDEAGAHMRNRPAADRERAAGAAPTPSGTTARTSRSARASSPTSTTPTCRRASTSPAAASPTRRSTSRARSSARPRPARCPPTRARRSSTTSCPPTTSSAWATTGRTRATRASGARCRSRTSRARRCSSGSRIRIGRGPTISRASDSCSNGWGEIVH